MDRFLQGLHPIYVESYGECLTGWEALIYAQRKGATYVSLRRGTLLIQASSGEEQRIEPVFVNGFKWVYPVAEIDLPA